MKWSMALGIAWLAWLPLVAGAQGAAGAQEMTSAQETTGSHEATGVQQATSVSDDDLRAYLGTLTLEARLDADLNGDGRPELIYVAADHNDRLLGILRGGEGAAGIGSRLLGEAPLVAAPRSSVSLALDNGELVVEQVAGEGAVSMTRYRYRYDAPARQVRLVDLSTEQYGNPVEQQTTRLEWNLDSGAHVVVHGEAVTLDDGQAVYVYGPETRTVRNTAPVYLAHTPDPLALLATEAKRGMVAASDGTAAR